MGAKKEKMEWPEDFGAAITVCDRAGTILYMNRAAAKAFAAEGGEKLIGTNLATCHKPGSWALIKRLIAAGGSNTYTIEKNGVKKLIHQAPWYEDGRCAGLVEISIELPPGMPHHRRT